MKQLDSLEPDVERLLRQILATASVNGAGKLAAWRKPERDIRRLTGRDYVRAVRCHLSYWEFKSLISDADRAFSRVGDNPMAMVSDRTLRRLAGELRFHVKAEPYQGPEGLALLGFYVHRHEGLLQRPLIYLNTAHVPVVVSTTFCHEFGHYLASRQFERRRELVHPLFDADYASHLDDPAELAADALTAVRGYPGESARRIFATPWNWGLVARTGRLTGDAFRNVRAYVGSLGFDFSPDLPAHQNLNYLAGMIHYAKLRWALLAEYDL